MNSPDRLEELYSTAAELGPAERAAWLDAQCAGDTELRREVDNLLRAGEGTLLDQAAFEMEARGLANAPVIPWERLGPYRIVSRIGAGGMGAVYLAERDDEGLSKRVAIKMVPWALSGDEALRRFQQERQILSRLEHPNIARMMDAGRSPDGMPYLVMEYVDGVALDAYAAGLPPEHRLQLFRVICAAVSYAHANLIVHRDLKPANILVTADGAPKLLDFGIARVIDESAAADLTSTRVMTAGYASPEQMAGQPITTASDVYSLGAILGELLTGKRPGRLDVTLPHINADLDNILAKAMRPESGRRYLSVADFSDDVQRYLEGYPVKARPDTFSYRAPKFLKRRRVEVFATALAASALAAAGIVTLTEYRAAERRFTDTRNLVNSFLFEVNDAITDLPGSTPARRLLAARAQQYLNILAEDRSSDTTVRRNLGIAYRKLADIQGRPYNANLGDTSGALANYRKSADILESIRPAFPGDPALLSELGRTYGRQAVLLGRQGRVDEAIQEGQKAVESLERAPAPSASLRRELGNAYLHESLAWLDVCAQRQSVAPCQSALTAAEKMRSVMMALQKEAPDNDENHAGLGEGLHFIGFAESHLARLTSDSAYARRSLEHHLAAHQEVESAFRMNPDRYRSTLADSWGDIGDAYVGAGDLSNGENAVRESLRIYSGIWQADPSNSEARRDVAVSHGRVAAVLAALHQDAAAAAEREQALAIYEWIFQRDSKNAENIGDIVRLRDLLAAYRASTGDRAAAVAHYRRNFALMKGLPSSPWAESEAALDYGLLGDQLAEVNAPAAADCYRAALAQWGILQRAGQFPPGHAEREARVRSALAALSSPARTH